MKNILFIGLLLLSMSACSSFLEEYSQDLARVENITDLDELLLGSAYLPAGKISSTSSGGSERRPVQLFHSFHVRRITAKRIASRSFRFRPNEQ